MNYPKISIVTPTFNQGQYIEETILSVINQGYPNLEYIVIDGGSTDNTIEIIKKYEKHLTYWESKPDRGQAHGINKGLAMATGEIFQWINSDDYLEKGALFKIAEAFVNPKVDVVAGKTVYFKDNEFEEPIQQSKLSAKGLMTWAKDVKFVQPGVWLKRQNIIDCGGIDESYHYSFDWDLLIRYLHKYNKINYIDNILVYFRLHENSKTSAFLDKFHDEEELILNKYIQNNEIKQLKKNAQKRKNRKIMYKNIENVSKNFKYSKSRKVKEIIKFMMKNPKLYINRISVGALRKNILK